MAGQFVEVLVIELRDVADFHADEPADDFWSPNKGHQETGQNRQHRPKRDAFPGIKVQCAFDKITIAFELEQEQVSPL